VQAGGHLQLADIPQQRVGTLDRLDDVTVDQRAHRFHREQRIRWISAGVVRNRSMSQM
jgi:hypothetical protein